MLALEDSGEGITRLLNQMAAGDQNATEALVRRTYRRLHNIANNYIRKERAGHTLAATALVNEAFIRIAEMHAERWQSSGHFIAVAAMQMRRILVDYARRRNARAEGHASPDGDVILAHLKGEKAKELIALDDALRRLAEVDPDQARIVEMKFFGGLEVEEIAELVKLSGRTVKREWALAKVWLHDEMTGAHRG